MKLTVQYRLKAPIGGDFSEEYAPRPEAGIILEQDIDEKTMDWQEVSDSMFEHAKIHVGAQLGIPMEKVDGALQPVFVIPDVPVRTPARRNTSGPKADRPTVVIDGVTFLDYRNSPEKAKNPKFPDFKTPDNKRSEWLTDKDGNPTKFAQDNANQIDSAELPANIT